MPPKWWLVSLAVAGFNADFNLKYQKPNLSNPYKKYLCIFFSIVSNIT